MTQWKVYSAWKADDTNVIQWSTWLLYNQSNLVSV